MELDERATVLIKKARKIKDDGLAAKWLSQETDRQALKAALEDTATADLLRTCMAFIGRGHCSYETTINILTSVQKMLGKLAGDNPRLLTKEAKTKLDRTLSELSRAAHQLDLDLRAWTKDQKWVLFQNTNFLALDRAIDVLECILESGPEDKTAQIRSRIMLLAAVRIMLPSGPHS